MTPLISIIAILVLGALVYGFLQPAKTNSPVRSEHTQDEVFNLLGKGDFEVEAVGESHYQDALRSIVGSASGYVRLDVAAELYCEDDNPYDTNAVRVMIDGQKVGYLSRDVAPTYRRTIRDAGFGKATGRCQAKIFGGGADKPSYGVWLDI